MVCVRMQIFRDSEKLELSLVKTSKVMLLKYFRNGYLGLSSQITSFLQ